MFKIIASLFSAKSQYFRLCALPPEEREKSVRLGVQSIVLSLVGLTFIIVGMVLGCMCLENMLSAKVGDEEYKFPILSLIGAIFFYGIAAAFLTNVVCGGLSFCVHQVRLNKRKIGWVALAICLVCIIVSIIVSILMIKSTLQA